jgi:hypothetical protein
MSCVNRFAILCAITALGCAPIATFSQQEASTRPDPETRGTVDTPGESPVKASQDDTEAVTQLGTVVVTGKRTYNRDELQEKIIPQFIRSHGANTRIGQLARWKSGICPKTDGVEPAYASFVSGRVQDIAKRVNAPLPAVCKAADTNVHILFTDEPQKLIDAIAAQNSTVLGFHFASQLKRISTVRHPIQAWYVTATQGRTGLPEIDNPFEGGPAGEPGSHFGRQLSSVFLHVLVVIDLNRMEDDTFDQISDYIGLLVLSQPASLDDCSELPSILDLFAAGCRTRPRPAELTAADAAYLTALYGIDLRTFDTVERGAISNRMMRAIEPR